MRYVWSGYKLESTEVNNITQWALRRQHRFDRVNLKTDFGNLVQNKVYDLFSVVEASLTDKILNIETTGALRDEEWYGHSDEV